MGIFDEHHLFVDAKRPGTGSDFPNIFCRPPNRLCRICLLPEMPQRFAVVV